MFAHLISWSNKCVSEVSTCFQVQFGKKIAWPSFLEIYEIFEVLKNSQMNVFPDCLRNNTILLFHNIHKKVIQYQKGKFTAKKKWFSANYCITLFQHHVTIKLHHSQTIRTKKYFDVHVQVYIAITFSFFRNEHTVPQTWTIFSESLGFYWWMWTPEEGASQHRTVWKEPCWDTGVAEEISKNWFKNVKTHLLKFYCCNWFIGLLASNIFSQLLTEYKAVILKCLRIHLNYLLACKLRTHNVLVLTFKCAHI